MLTIRPFIMGLVATLFIGARVNGGGLGIELEKSPDRDVAIGETVTLTATLDDGAEGKQVQFTRNGQAYGSATTNSEGKATTTYVPAAAGAASFVASCQGYINSAQVGVTAVAATITVQSATVGVSGIKDVLVTVTVGGSGVEGITCGGPTSGNTNIATAAWLGSGTTDAFGSVVVRVNGVAAGQTTVTVTGGGGSGQGDVTVAVPTISVPNVTVGVGGAKAFSVTITAGGSPVENLTCGGPTSGNTNIASAEWAGSAITDSFGIVGVRVTGVAAGQTTVTVTGGGGSGQGNVTAEVPTIDVPDIIVSVSGTKDFSVRVTAGGLPVEDLTCGGPMSGNTNVATTEWLGSPTTGALGIVGVRATGVAAGETTVTVTGGGGSDDGNITVTDP